MSVHFETGFVSDMEEEYLELLGSESQRYKGSALIGKYQHGVGLKQCYHTYQNLLETSDEAEYDAYMESL